MFEISTLNDITVVDLSGELSHLEMEQIEGVLGNLMGHKKTKVILNFQRVDHVNYKTLQRLLDKAEELRALDGDLKCASMNHYTQNIFRFTGADQSMEAYESVGEAVLSFDGAGEKHRTWH